jgi:CHAT domain-containing protein
MIVRRRFVLVLAGLATACCLAQEPGGAGTGAPRPEDGPRYFEPVSRAASVTADARVREVETLARLASEGRSLYDEDERKLNGYAYCSNAAAFAERGELRLAVREASKALFLGQSRGDHDLAALAKGDLAVAYSYAGNLDLAQQYAEESMAQGVRPANRVNVFGRGYKVLGDVALRRGDPTRAINWYRNSYAFNDGDVRFFGRASLANAYLAAGDVAKAAAATKDAEGYLEFLNAGERRAGEAALLRIRANLALKDGNPAAARDLFAQLVVRSDDSDRAYQRYWALEGRARAELQEGDAAAARRSYAEAIAAAEDVRARFRSEEFSTGIFGELRQAYDEAVRLAMEANEPEAAWLASEGGRSRALLDLVRNRVKLASASNVFIDPLGGIVGLAQIQAVLGPAEAVVEYHVLPSRTYAWVIRKDKVTSAAIEVKRADLARQVQAFRLAVAERQDRAADAGAQLHDLLVRPLGIAAGEALVVVPHDVLHYVPFQALRGSGGYLIETSALSYAPSASALAALMRRDASKSGKLLALGNPDLGNPQFALPGAQSEVVAIKALFADQESYFLKDATKRRLLGSAAGANVVHVAAHAEVDTLDPLHSRIFLAPEGKDRGTLEARDIYPLDLRRTGLVTLSACESGLGRVSSGDEIWGFTRSVLGAGAPALLVSLWPVADESTERLMTRFYRDLGASTDARESLRAAQLNVMRDPKFSHPFFWAPFNLVGNWR